MMMNVNRLTLVFVCVLFLGCSAFKEELEEKPDHEPEPKRSFFGIFRKPYQQDDTKQGGFNIGGHFGSSLTGGMLGFQVELNPLKKVHDVIGVANRFIPQVPGGFGRPPARPVKPHEKPPTDSGNWESDGDDWEPKDPSKPKPEGPKWEDIGEKPKPDGPGNPKPENPDWDYNDKKEDHVKPKPDRPSWEDIGEDSDYVTVPIEDIIQPRLKPRSRTKRFIESKIYHVPLLFSSNARPYKVDIKTQDLLRKKVRKEGKI